MKESTLDKIITEEVKKSIILLERVQEIGRFNGQPVRIMSNGLMVADGLADYQKQIVPGFEKDGQIYTDFETIADDFDGDRQAAIQASQYMFRLKQQAKKGKIKADKEASEKSARDLALRIQASMTERFPTLIDFGKHVFNFTKKAPKGIQPGYKNVKGFGDFLPLTKEPEIQPNIGFTRRSTIGGRGQFVSPFNIPMNYQNKVNFYGVKYLRTGMAIGGVNIGYYVFQVQRAMNLSNHRAQIQDIARRGRGGSRQAAKNIINQIYHAGFGPVYNMVMVVPENIGTHKNASRVFGVTLNDDEITNFLSNGFSFFNTGGKPPILMAGIKKTTSMESQYDDFIGLIGGKQRKGSEVNKSLPPVIPQ